MVKRLQERERGEGERKRESEEGRERRGRGERERERERIKKKISLIISFIIYQTFNLYHLLLSQIIGIMNLSPQYK